MTGDEFVSRLTKVTGRGARWRAVCPSCGRKNGSKLSILERDDGAIMVKCWGGCSTEEVVSSVGLKLSDLFPESSRRAPAKGAFGREGAAVLSRELNLAWVLLTDLAAGRPISDADRRRAGECARACASMLRGLE